jgi:hypothetical protein
VVSKISTERVESTCVSELALVDYLNSPSRRFHGSSNFVAATMTNTVTKPLSSNRILVTGAWGFTGAWLTEHLLNECAKG